MLDQQGIKFEMPALPDFKAIASGMFCRERARDGFLEAVDHLQVFETVPVVGNSLSAVPAAGLSAAPLAPAIQAARGATGNNSSMNNLKQIAFAMHNYQNVYKTFRWWRHPAPTANRF